MASLIAVLIVLAVSLAAAAWIGAWDTAEHGWNEALYASLRAREKAVIAAHSPDPFAILREVFRVIALVVSVIVAAL